MNCYSPTALRIHADNCPYALELYQKRLPFDDRFMVVGRIFHECMHYLTHKANKQERNLDYGELCQHIEAFEIQTLETTDHRLQDIHEALQLVRRQCLNDPPQWTDQTEIDLGCNKDFRPIEPHRFHGIIDRLRIVDNVVRITDYKTSWAASCEDVYGIQLAVYAVIAQAHYPNHEVVAEICNVRKQETYPLIPNINLLQNKITARAARADAHREPLPGGGCLTCRFTEHCEHFKKPSSDPLIRHVQLTTELETLESKLREKAFNAPIESSGLKAGYIEKPQRTVSNIQPLLNDWIAAGKDRAEFFEYATPGVSGIESIARKLRPRDKAGQDELLADVIETKTTKRFKVEATPRSH